MFFDLTSGRRSRQPHRRRAPPHKGTFYEVAELTPISKTAGHRALGTKFGPPSRPPRIHELIGIEKKNMSRFGRV